MLARLHRLSGVALLLLVWTVYAIQGFKGVLIVRQVPHATWATVLNVVVLAPGLIPLVAVTALALMRRRPHRAWPVFATMGLHVLIMVALSPAAVREASVAANVTYWTAQTVEGLLALWVLRFSLLVRPMSVREQRVTLVIYGLAAWFLGTSVVGFGVANHRLRALDAAVAQGAVTEVLVARQSLDDDLLHPAQDTARLARLNDGPVRADPVFFARLRTLLGATWAFPADHEVDPFAKLVVQGPQGPITLVVDVQQGFAQIDGTAFYLLNWADLMGLVADTLPPPKEPGSNVTDRRTVVRLRAMAPTTTAR